jgi:hypothetical protein
MWWPDDQMNTLKHTTYNKTISYVHVATHKATGSQLLTVIKHTSQLDHIYPTRHSKSWPVVITAFCILSSMYFIIVFSTLCIWYYIIFM